MIELEFIKSPDLDLTSKFKVSGNRLILGKTKMADLLIADPTFSSLVFALEVYDQQTLVAYIENNTQLFFVNNKKVSGKKKILIDDIIQIGETIFKVIKAEFLLNYDSKLRLTNNYKKILKTDELYSELLHELEKELILIQTLQNERANK